jgi:hypothetical protein
MQTLKRLIVGLLMALPVSGAADAQQIKHAKHSSVCLARTHYKDFAKTNLSIDATVFADGMHGALLLDDKCPDLGLTLGVSLPNADSSVSDFDKALWSAGSPGTAGAKVTGTFIGRLRRDPRSRRIHYDLLSVENLCVTPTPERHKP